MRRVLVLGGVSFNTIVDIEGFPEPRPQTIISRGFHETIGSTGAGKALNLRKLGLEITLHGLIGEDQHGHAIIDYLRGQQITFVYDLDPRGTQRHLNLMDRAGRRISIFLEPGTHDPSFDQPRIERLVPESQYIVLNISNYCRALIPAIQRAQQPIWCDIHDYDGENTYYDDFIQAADYLFMSSDNLPDHREFMRRTIAQGKQLVVCTHGRRGASALTSSGIWIETPILASYAAIDSNGAGDAFFAGVLYGHERGCNTTQCLRLGTVTAGLCVTSPELALPELSATLVEREYFAAYGEPLGTDQAHQ